MILWAIIRYMKAVMIAIIFASLNIFFYFENHWVKCICACCGIAALIYACKLGRGEDAKKKVEQDNRLAQIEHISLITPNTDTNKSQHKNLYQRIVAWLHKRSNRL